MVRRLRGIGEGCRASARRIGKRAEQQGAGATWQHGERKRNNSGIERLRTRG